ncbi:MAG: hypothetical protein OEY56_14020 [Cyclobacteriaceae bacterium]|nr:hypothetical protein [Cyclobacteriaceae bacterium]
MKNTWYILMILATTLVIPFSSQAQNRTLDVGVRLQKTFGMYSENGLSAQYTDQSLMKEKLYFGLSYFSSLMGSALASNAIRQHNLLLSTALAWRPAKTIRPFVRLNTGFFIARYEPGLFDALPNKSLLLSTDFGIAFQTKCPLSITPTLGYNLITGDGVSGPGTLFPVFLQTTVSWNIYQR